MFHQTKTENFDKSYYFLCIYVRVSSKRDEIEMRMRKHAYHLKLVISVLNVWKKNHSPLFANMP